MNLAQSLMALGSFGAQLVAADASNQEVANLLRLLNRESSEEPAPATGLPRNAPTVKPYRAAWNWLREHNGSVFLENKTQFRVLARGVPYSLADTPYGAVRQAMTEAARKPPSSLESKGARQQFLTDWLLANQGYIGWEQLGGGWTAAMNDANHRRVYGQGKEPLAALMDLEAKIEAADGPEDIPF